jgi:hypothetical protein
MTTDARLIAAHLAAALIAGKPLDKANGAATAAAKLYFDVLDAVMKEQERRYASPTGRASG